MLTATHEIPVYSFVSGKMMSLRSKPMFSGASWIVFTASIRTPPNLAASNVTIALGSTIKLGSELLQIAASVKH